MHVRKNALRCVKPTLCLTVYTVSTYVSYIYIHVYTVPPHKSEAKRLYQNKANLVGRRKACGTKDSTS